MRPVAGRKLGCLVRANWHRFANRTPSATANNQPSQFSLYKLALVVLFLGEKRSWLGEYVAKFSSVYGVEHECVRSELSDINTELFPSLGRALGEFVMIK